MGNFNRDGGRGGFGGRDGGRPEFKKKWDGGDRNRAQTMHKATCANCGKTCEVPFRPNGEKPVYCSDCFGAMRDGGDRAPRREYNDAPRKDFGDRRESFTKPESTQAPDKRIDGLLRSLDMVNSKLDRLMDMVRANTRPAQPQPVKEVQKEKPAVVAAPAPVKMTAPAKPVAKKEVAKKAAPKAAPKVPAKKAPLKKKK